MNYGSRTQRGLYFAAPHFVKEALATVYGIQQRRARYGQAFRDALAFLRETESWDNDRLGEYQRKRAAQFVDHALESAPYYRQNRAYDAYRRTKDFSTLPILPKEQVRARLEDFYSDELSRLPHQWRHTSGTTGKSLVFPVTRKCFQREYAFRAYHYSWAGVDLNRRDPIAFCQGHPIAHYDRNQPPFWVCDYANNFLYLSSYHLSPRNLRSYCAVLDRFAPVMLSGYPSSVYCLAFAYRQYGQGRMRLRGVFTTSETVFSHQRPLMEKVFGCKVFDAYGNSEMCSYVMQCERGEFHLKPEHSLTEILDEDGRPARPGEPGRVVATAFGNPALPLVRYEIGDLVTVSASQKAQCGRSGLLLDAILGRVEDYVIAADGRLVGRLDHLFKDSTSVVEAQIVQEQVGEIVLRLVTTPYFCPADEKAIRAEAQLRLGSGTRIRIEFTPSIERSENGKFRFIVSKLDHRAALQAFANAGP